MRFPIFLFLVAVCALRLAVASHYELTPDEAYYQMWSERLDWGYYSKGPGIAFAIRLGTMAFGVTEFGVRWLSPVLGLLTALLLSNFARRLFGHAAALWTAVLCSVIPIFNVGGVLLTIDPLCIFFWVAALVSTWRALEVSPRFSFWWLLTGIWIALGFLAKFTNAMQIVSIVLALAWVPKWRRELRGAGFWSMLAIALLGAIPPAIWNAEHAWITVTHLIERGGLDSNKGVRWTAIFEFLGQQALVFSPLIWLGLIIAFFGGFGAARRAKSGQGEKIRFLLAHSIPILLLYTLLALRKPGEPNWTVLGFPSLLVLGAWWWHERVATSRGAARFSVAALVLGLLASIVIIDTDLLRQAGFNLAYREPSGRLRGWRTTAELVQSTRNKFEKELGEKVFLVSDRYQLAAELNFYLPEKRIELPGHPVCYLPESQAIQNQFSFWGRYDEFSEPDPAKKAPIANAPENEQPEAEGESRFAGRSALFITDNSSSTAPPDSLQDGFAEWKCIARHDIRRRGLTVRTITIFALYRYQGMSL